MKRIIAALVLIPLLFSCSPSKTEYDESGLVSGTASAAGGVDSPYTPKTVYTLNADEDDFLDQSFQLPFYADKTTKELEEIFYKSQLSYYGTGMATITAVLPETVVFLSGQFAYDKKTGRISRTCKDPQCRHSHLLTDIYGSCKFMNGGSWLIRGDRIYANRFDITGQDLVTTVFTTDFAFNDPHYADLPKGAVVQCISEDGRLVLRKEQLVPYIDKNGVQRKKQGNFEILLYDEKTKETTVAFAPEKVFFTYSYKTALFCQMYPEYTMYAFFDNCSKSVALGKAERFGTFFDGKALFEDADTKKLMFYDTVTHEISEAGDKYKPVIQYCIPFDTGEELYFKYEYDAEEKSDLFDDRQSAAILAFAKENGLDKVDMVCRCDYAAESIEPVYFSEYTFDSFAVDGEVLYIAKRDGEGKQNFNAYDMSSGVELQILLPRFEEHYPGEYGYDENWRRGVN